MRQCWGAKNLSAGAYPAKSNSALFSSTSLVSLCCTNGALCAEREIMPVHNSCGCCRSDWKRPQSNLRLATQQCGGLSGVQFIFSRMHFCWRRRSTKRVIQIQVRRNKLNNDNVRHFILMCSVAGKLLCAWCHCGNRYLFYVMQFRECNYCHLPSVRGCDIVNRDKPRWSQLTRAIIWIVSRRWRWNYDCTHTSSSS